MYKKDEYTVERKLVIHCPDEFNEALQFSAKNTNNELQCCIMQLMTGDYYGAKELHLYKDFVKHSFGFALISPEDDELDIKSHTFLNGGIILHGYEETFSIEINPVDDPHYSIHT